MTYVATKQLGAGLSIGTTEVTLYTVPNGHRTIVKNVTMANRNAAANFAAISFYNPSTQIALWREYMAAAGADGDTIIRNTWVVMNAGDRLTVVGHLSPVSVIVSGSELVLP